MDGTRKECTIMFSSSQREGINHTFLHNPPSKAPEGKGRTCHSSKIGLFWFSAWVFPLGLWQTWIHPESLLSTAGETEAAFLSWAYVQGFSLSPSPSSTVPFLFSDCQADISERKHLYKLSDHIFGTSHLRLQWVLWPKDEEIDVGQWARQRPGRETVCAYGHTTAVCLLTPSQKRLSCELDDTINQDSVSPVSIVGAFGQSSALWF